MQLSICAYLMFTKTNVPPSLFSPPIYLTNMLTLDNCSACKQGVMFFWFSWLIYQSTPNLWRLYMNVVLLQVSCHMSEWIQFSILELGSILHIQICNVVCCVHAAYNYLYQLFWDNVHTYFSPICIRLNSTVTLMGVSTKAWIWR